MTKQNEQPVLTYAMVTRNKLPYLKVVLPRVIANRQPDDEIIIIDGNSNDGTVDYLSELEAQGKIDKFISEPDKCEAHAANKALLLARGQLVKTLTDDDLFHWPSIQAGKRFMLEHPEIDLLSGNMAFTTIFPGNDVIVPEVQPERHYREWLTSGKPFPGSGLTLLIRKSSLPLLGLWHTGCLILDYEYLFRATLVGKVAWHTALWALRMHNPNSTEQPGDKNREDERARLFHFYKYRPPLRRRLHFLRMKLLGIRQRVNERLSGVQSQFAISNDIIPDFFDLLEKRLFEENERNPGTFLCRESD